MLSASSKSLYEIDQGFYEIEMGFYDIEVGFYEIETVVYDLIFDDLLGALAVLELHGGDTTSIEAKTFSEYSPEQLGPTLSAFANKPGGGVILLRHCRPIADTEPVRGSSLHDLD